VRGVSLMRESSYMSGTGSGRYEWGGGGCCVASRVTMVEIQCTIFVVTLWNGKTIMGGGMGGLSPTTIVRFIHR